jgi:hypothetical protein
MIVNKNEATATGFFFMTFTGALSVLSEALKEEEEQASRNSGSGSGDSRNSNNNINIWASASVTTVPLDIALRLSVKKMERVALNQKNEDVKLDSIVDIIPGLEQREDALQLDTSNNNGKFQEQGRVPLFYVEQQEQVKGQQQIPLPVYFDRKELEAQWATQVHDGPPRVKVMDLLDLFQTTLRGNSNNARKVVFRPSQETLQIAAELQSRKLTLSYKTDKMVIVGGK